MQQNEAQQAAQQAANRWLNETILDLPKFYGTTKDTATAENLIDRINASIHATGLDTRNGLWLLQDGLALQRWKLDQIG